MIKRILIIEDDLALRQTLEAALEAENFEVLSAADGEEGYKIAIQENIDLVNELSVDNFVVLHTSRRREFAEATLTWLHNHGVRYQAIHFEKMPADLYIDNKSFNPKWR